MLAQLLLWLCHGADCYCWGAGKNPGFSGAPRVTQVALDRVKVEWEGMVTQEECADNYVVKYWQRAAPDDYHITEIVPKERYQVINLNIVGCSCGKHY